MSADELATLTHAGRTFTVRRDRRREALILSGSATGSEPAWEASLPIVYHYAHSATLVRVKGWLEVRAECFHTKDDARRELLFRYTLDGALLDA